MQANSPVPPSACPQSSAARPGHIAIIMDGNGRWAQARGLPRGEGHRRGVEAVRRTVRAARAAEITHLTLFSFSSENWNRPPAEVHDLMSLLRLYIRSDLAELNRADVKIRIIGERNRIDGDLLALLDEAESLTRGNGGVVLTVAFNYGGRDEIVRAARRLAASAAAGKIEPHDIDDDMFSSALDTSGMPDPDLLIRTSGELRISNFLLWQLAYAEFVFLDVLWPDFSAEHLNAAIDEFGRRNRRFGGVELAGPSAAKAV